MKKREIISILEKHNVKSTNIISFSNSHKKMNLNIDKCRKWLQIIEDKKIQNSAKLRIKTTAKKYKMSVNQYNKLQVKAQNILKHFETNHKMGCMKTLTLSIKNKDGNVCYDTFVSVNNTSEYSLSCKYRALHGKFDISMTKKELIEIENIDGIWTIQGNNHKCKWLESAGNKSSYYVHLIDGFSFCGTHGYTLIEAKKSFRKKYLQLQKKKMSDKKFIGISKLQNIGACMPGITAFAERHNLNIVHGYNLEYLKSLENNSFLNNICL